MSWRILRTTGTVCGAAEWAGSVVATLPGCCSPRGTASDIRRSENNCVGQSDRDSKLKAKYRSSEKGEHAGATFPTNVRYVIRTFVLLIVLSLLGVFSVTVGPYPLDSPLSAGTENASQAAPDSLPSLNINVTHSIVDLSYTNNSLRFTSEYLIGNVSKGYVTYRSPPQSSFILHDISGGKLSNTSNDGEVLNISIRENDSVRLNYTIVQDETDPDQVQKISYSYVYHALPTVSGAVTVNQSRYRITQSSLTTRYDSTGPVGREQSSGDPLFTDPAITGSSHAVTITDAEEVSTRTWSGPMSTVTVHDHTNTIDTNEDLTNRVRHVVNRYHQLAQAVVNDSSTVTINIVDSLANDISGAALRRSGGEASIILQRTSLLTRDTLAHELVHTLQRTTVAADMQWWYEASAEHYAMMLSPVHEDSPGVIKNRVYNAGWVNRTAAQTDGPGLTQPYQQMSLADPSSWKKRINYFRGARVLGHIEHALDRHGTASMTDVFEWMNDQSGRVEYEQFRSFLSEHTSAEFIDSLDTYVYGNSTVPLPGT